MISSVCVCTYMYVDSEVSHICHCLNLKENRVFSICFSLPCDTFAMLNLTEFSKLGEISKQTDKNKHPSSRYELIM